MLGQRTKARLVSFAKFLHNQAPPVLGKEEMHKDATGLAAAVSSFFVVVTVSYCLPSDVAGCLGRGFLGLILI